MKLQTSTSPHRWPTLREVLKTTSQSGLPPHSVLETSADFQIAFNLFGCVQSRLHVSITPSAHRLHVVGIKRFHDMEAEFLWVFDLPKFVDIDDIRIASKNDVHLIHIPKNKRTPQHLQRTTSPETQPIAVA